MYKPIAMPLIERLVEEVRDAVAPVWADLTAKGLHPAGFPTGYGSLGAFLDVLLENSFGDRLLREVAVKVGVRYLGHGNSRAAFDVDGVHVVKVPLHDEGTQDQINEIYNWCVANEDARRWLMPICDYDHDGRWLIMYLSPDKGVSHYEEARDTIRHLGFVDPDNDSNWGTYEGCPVLVDYA